MQKKILITGISGFIGKEIASQLVNSNYEIHGLSRSIKSNSSYFHHTIDLDDHSKISQLLSNIKPEYIIHTAWYNEHNKYWDSPENINSLKNSINLYENFLKNRGKKIIFLGTSDEYSNQKNKCHEKKSIISPSNLYSSSKHLLHQYVQQKYINNKIPFNWLRIFYPVGRGEKKQRLIPHLISELKNKKTPYINNPNYTKDLIHIEDCAAAIIKCMNSDYIGAVNIGSGKGIKLSTIKNYIIKELGYGKILINNKKNVSNDIKNYLVSNDSILKNKIRYKIKHSHKSIIKHCCNL
tara:strand:- start:23263 stop:24147 length:885 start_codon:yes stop_codon:yes gene_type:complete